MIYSSFATQIKSPSRIVPKVGTHRAADSVENLCVCMCRLIVLASMRAFQLRGRSHSNWNCYFILFSLSLVKLRFIVNIMISAHVCLCVCVWLWNCDEVIFILLLHSMCMDNIFLLFTASNSTPRGTSVDIWSWILCSIHITSVCGSVICEWRSWNRFEHLNYGREAAATMATV